MALSRRKWNNIIIIACLMMIGTLTILDNHTNKLPDDALPLFDDSTQLTQLQLENDWLHQGNAGWQCAEQVLNCEQWAKAWENLKVSALTYTPELFSQPRELLLQVRSAAAPSSQDTQVWLLFSEQGLLKSPANNWYEIPPSLRNDLQPIISATSPD